MPSGLTVYTSSGQLQIDDRFSNLVLAASGQVDVRNDNRDYVDLTLGATKPLLAFVPSSNSGGGMTMDCPTKVGTDLWRFRFRPKIAFGVTDEFDWFLFDDVSAVEEPSGNVGLQVFNGSGVVTFDSRHRYMRVADSISYKITDYSGGDVPAVNWTRSLTSGRRYASAPLSVARHQESSYSLEDNGLGFLYSGTTSISHHATSWSSAHELSGSWAASFSDSYFDETIPIDFGDSTHYYSLTLIVDVTGY